MVLPFIVTKVLLPSSNAMAFALLKGFLLECILLDSPTERYLGI